MKIFFFLYKKIITIFFKFYYGKITVLRKVHPIQKYFINNKLHYDFYEIDNCRVFTNTNDVAYIKDNKIIDGPSLQIRKNGLNSKPINNTVILNGTPKIYRHYDKRVFSLLTGLNANNNYFHWFFDSLPRLILFKKFYKINKDDFFLVQNYFFDYQKISLKMLGVKNIINAYEIKHIFVKKVIAVNFYRNHANPPDWISKNLSKYFNKTNYKNKHVKVFINRTNISSNIRDIYNKEEVVNFLKKKKFKIIDPSKLTFLQEIKLFRNAKIVAGVYGAGLTNIIFCNKKCKIIEFKKFNTNKLYENIAKQLGLKYYLIKGNLIKNSTTKRNFDGSIYISLNKVSSLINKI